MNLHDLIREQERFVADREWQKFHTVENLCKAISVEAGELLELVLWTDGTEGNRDFDLEHIEEEVADIFLYTVSLCSILNIDPIDAMHQKIHKNEQKYPKEIFKGRI